MIVYVYKTQIPKQGQFSFQFREALTKSRIVIQNQIPQKKKKKELGVWDDKKCNLSKNNSRIRYEVGIPEMLEDEEHHKGNIEAFVVGRDNYVVLVPLRHSELGFTFGFGF
jgi:hypothetical protein